MNSSYKVIDNKVFVYDEFYDETEREFTNNIEEILITENNIEEIEDIIHYQIYINNLNTPQLIMSSFLGLGTAQFITGVFRLLTDGISSSLFHFLMSTTFCSLSYPIGIKPYLKEKRNLKLKKYILEDALAKEKEKLNKLNEDKTNDLEIVTEIPNIIFTSKEISILKERLNDIKLYMNNRHKFIKLYKKGELSKLFYECSVNSYTIDFIKELIELDLGIETKKENNKQIILEKK